jgi:hypothetical protein
MRTMVFQYTTKFIPCSRWFLGSLEFLTDQFGNLSLQKPELSEVIESGTDRLLLAPVRIGRVIKAQLRLGSSGKTDTDPVEDRNKSHLGCPGSYNRSNLLAIFRVKL